MSNSQHRSEKQRLPPIGFEEHTQVPVTPLKKKKRKGHHRLRTIVDASSQFGSAGQGTHKQPSRVINHPPQPPVGTGDSRHQYRPEGEVQLRQNSSRIRNQPSDKRFTLSDFAKDQPTWLREKSLKLSTGMAAQGESVQDILKRLYTAPERDRIDYVLCHQIPDDSEAPDDKRRQVRRNRFEDLLIKEGFKLEHEQIGDNMFCKLHCSFRRLCKEAERVKLQMPLKDMEIADDDEDNAITRWIDEKFATDDEVDFVSAPFEQMKLHLYKNCEQPDLFFRSSLRCLLTEHCLKNLDMRQLPQTPQYYYHHDDELEDNPEEDILAKQGLPYLLMKKVYNDAFVLHDESEDNLKESQKYSEEGEVKEDKGKRQAALESVLSFYGDARHDLNVTWPNVLKFQPLWKIRNYFGEEIALYFAWVGLLILSIMLPMFFGLGVFGYGMYCSLSGNCEDTAVNTTATTNVTGSTTSAGFVESSLLLLDSIKEAFDNDSTPFYAVAICIWSTIFMELWKRKNAILAYEWDVKDFDSAEPDRPSYYGTDTMKDPITQEEIPFYPFKYKCVKYSISFITFLTMVCVVFAILASVTLYRVIITVNYCDDWNKDSSLYCFLVTTIGSSLLNAIAILVLGKIYEKLAVVLTDWENHRTGSAYKNALIIKLFAFQFANCYSSLYYIAFFRSANYENGIFGLGDDYQDSCGTSCMADLSFQVLILMVIKPLPRLLKDVILPWVLKKLKMCCKKKSSVDPEVTKEAKEEDFKSRFLEAEKTKPNLQDFTLNEYTEKVIQYGLVVLFAAAMPLGPLIAVLVNTLDRVVDSKRILWMYRRPVPTIAQDIGMWHHILDFLNLAAVITNAFLIAYVSKWGRRNFEEGHQQLWVVLVFEHAVLILKYVLAMAIPDVPHRIRIAMRKEKFTVAKILETGAFVKDFSSNAPTKEILPLESRMSPEGEKRVNSASFDTVTTRNVALESRGPIPRQRHPHPAPDVPDGAHTGNTERVISRAAKSPESYSRQPTSDSSDFQSQPPRSVQQTPAYSVPSTPLPKQPSQPQQPSHQPPQHSHQPAPSHPPQNYPALQQWDIPESSHTPPPPLSQDLYHPPASWTPDVPPQSGHAPSHGNVYLNW